MIGKLEAWRLKEVAKKTCPKCGALMEYNIAYGTDDCPKCGHVEGNSD